MMRRYLATTRDYKLRQLLLVWAGVDGAVEVHHAAVEQLWQLQIIKSGCFKRRIPSANLAD